MSDVVFKKRSRPAASSRKRALETDDSASAASEVVKIAKRADTGPLSHSTGPTRRQAKERAQEDEDLLREEFSEQIGVSFKAGKNNVERRSRSPEPEPQTLAGDDALEATEGPMIKRTNYGDVVDGFVLPHEPKQSMYRGQAAYGSQLPAGSSKFGPIKAPNANIRTITLTDFQPDICKDYKETGFCGFGDSCKFLHDRSDYLHGWQIDNMFLSQQSQAAQQVEEIIEEELPFACLICREEFTEPVVTLCGHYFCQRCALARYARNSKCAACGAATKGIFNRAERIIEKKKKAQELRLGKIEVDPYAELDAAEEGVLDDLPEA